ncbi:hypothetical protein FVE85_2340 [Porphyridium purpureum]|uniref:Uncharacterized protein n=1 Tax=Porphyridium purpureum TaxID=35688 RepID=A0A5J4YYI5_PORPP|nr:hypothetical protein FVE85_2340 [Porphyridium purpureum]|eukprot:POR4935..scf209_3
MAAFVCGGVQVAGSRGARRRHGRSSHVAASPAVSTPGTRRATRVSMIQSPFSEGPPGIEEYYKQKMGLGKKITGEPMVIGTGRATLEECAGDSQATCAKALQRAMASAQVSELASCELVHVTYTLNLDPAQVWRAIDTEHHTRVLGRSITKKDTAEQVEVMVITGGSGVTIGWGRAHVKDVEDNLVSDDETVGVSPTVGETMQAAVDAALLQAAEEAVTDIKSSDPGDVTFFLFSHTPGARTDHVRASIEQQFANCTAYGGPAAGDASQNGKGWSVLTHEGRVASGDVSEQEVVIAAVSGSLSFMLSAVVKTWAQPSFQEPLSYMIPQYTDNAALNLLTAIRYDDWEKFIECIETKNVEINHKWQDKQNQIPLLAACARCRTRMVRYLLERGADITHRNDGGFTAIMYTKLLEEFDPDMVNEQLAVLEAFGANMVLTEEEKALIAKATSGRLNKK